MGAYGITVLSPKMLSTDEFNSYIDEQFTKRQSYALWFVSNCNSKVRLNYYEQLQSVYPRIKIHGDCVKQINPNYVLETVNVNLKHVEIILPKNVGVR